MKKRSTHFAFFLLLLLAFQGHAIAQTTDLPKIIKPSPEVASLFKFQDYPMDYSTGLPQVSIPLYEVKSGSLSLPVSLNYHASGRKVNDQDGAIAANWSLSAGGMISRTVKGSVDYGTPTQGTLAFPNPFKLDNITNYDDLNYLQKIIHLDNYDCGTLPWNDSEYDIFSYSFGGKSGKFFFKDVAGVKTPVLLPYKPYKIIPYYNTTGINSFDIIDDEGILYQFTPTDFYNLGSNATTTGWSLTKITSANKADVITLVYTAASEKRTTIAQSTVLIDDWSMQLEAYPSNYLTDNEYTTEENYQTPRLSQIIFNQGKLITEFVSGTSKIDNIRLVDNAGTQYKKVQLSRSQMYSQSELQQVVNKLDAIQFKDKNNNTVESYSFEYYPVISSNGEINARYCDWWGYYNNSGQHDFVPRWTGLTYISSGGNQPINIGNVLANRNPSLEPIKSGMLKKITYPTGGSTELIYELNRCTLNGATGTPINGPGLRLFQQKTEDQNGNVHYKTFKYGTGESGYGAIDMLPEMENMTNAIINVFHSSGAWTSEVGRAGKYRVRTFSSSFNGELAELADRPVFYQEVTEYQGTTERNSGKTIYQYDYPGWAASGMPTTVPGNALLVPKKHIFNFNYWNTPAIINKSTYKMVMSGPVVTYKKIAETANTYQSTTVETIRGLHVQRNVSTPQKGYGSVQVPGASGPGPGCSEQCATYGGLGNLSAPYIYCFSDYQLPVGYKNLMSTQDITYAEDGSALARMTTYQYNSRQMLSQSSVTQSNGSVKTTQVKYPFDYPGNSVLDQMVLLNILAKPVERIESVNAVHARSVRNTYGNWGSTNPNYALSTVEEKIAAGAYVTRLRYYGYDAAGNVRTVGKELDAQQSYVWGYNNEFPIAEVANALAKNVFHTSFEDATGNSTTGDAKTGRKSRTGGYSTTLTGLDNGTYVLSYWLKSGAVWQLQQSEVTVASGSYALTLGGQVDEVRFYPKTALMKTISYDPLVGILSGCDEAGRCTSYEYDDYGRLILVRDPNGNIIKTVKYGIKSSAAN